MAEKPFTDGEPAPDNVEFHYQKSTHFRTIHADGAIGNVTPGQYIQMAIYSERLAIPKRTVHELKPEGGLGEVIEEQTDSLKGVVREMEVNVLMSVGIAKAISTWLQGRIEQIEQAENIKQTESETDKQNGE